MKVTDYIASFIVEHGIAVVFGYTGGNIADLVDSISKTESLRYFQTCHEQAAAFAANAYAQTTEKIGVAISSSGPGAINLLNGIANAYYDSIPCVFITGNVHSLGKKKSDEIRQNAFQETDIVSMTKTITKYNVYLDQPNKAKSELQKAFYIANEGRKGPVLIDIPYDIQRMSIELNEMMDYYPPEQKANEFEIDEILKLLMNSKRPLFLLGGGCQHSKENIREIFENNSIPVVVSMRGLDILPHDFSSYIGFIGSYGNRTANLAIRYCDLLIVLGSRLDERQMGYRENEFAPDAKIVQIDIDKTELGRKTNNIYSFLVSVEEFTSCYIKKAYRYPNRKWLYLLQQWKEKYENEVNESVINSFVYSISALFHENAIVSVDVGQNQMICAQSLMLKRHTIFLGSAGLACMGYSLPAAIGANSAYPQRQIISINGDGGFLMNVQELQTIKREQLPIKIIVLNNSCLGMIRKLQEKMFNNNYYGSVEGYLAIDFQKIAMAFEFAYLRINTQSCINESKKVFENSLPAIIEIELPTIMETKWEPAENIYTQIPRLTNLELTEIQRQVDELC